MTTYEKSKYRLQLVSGTSLLDTGMRLDEDTLDEEAASYTDVPVSAVTIVDGYTLGESGEQSIDPATGSATFAEYISDVNDREPFLYKGDYVESYYGQVLGFSGFVRQVDVEIEVDPSAHAYGHSFLKRTTYLLSSLELLLLSRIASWESLPEEPALDRLSRWFDVDITGVTGISMSHRTQLYAMMPAEEAGSATLLDIARGFSAATRIPLRLALHRGENVLEAFDNTINWIDAPLTPVAGFEDSTTWTNGVGLTDGVPTSLKVTANDMRLTGGVTSYDVDQPLPDESFFLDSSPLDEVTEMPVGFRAPYPVDVFGTTMPVLRVTQTFGEVYRASIETDPTGGGAALDVYEPVSFLKPRPPTTTTTTPDSTDVRGPGGDFLWGGVNWVRRSRSGGPHLNNLTDQPFDPNNVIGPDENGWITLKITNPTGNLPIAAEMETTYRHFGYGTYSMTVAGRVDTFHKNVVFGGLFTYNFDDEPIHHEEIDMFETSAWSGGPSQTWPVALNHHYYADDNNELTSHMAGEIAYGSDALHHHVVTWEPGRLTYTTYIGGDTTGPVLLHSEATDKIPVPQHAGLHVNLWAFVGAHGNPYTMPEQSIILRNFSYKPLSTMTGASTEIPPIQKPPAVEGGPESPILIPWYSSIAAENRGTPGNIPLIARGMAGQTGHMFEVQDADYNEKFSINPDGGFNSFGESHVHAPFIVEGAAVDVYNDGWSPFGAYTANGDNIIHIEKTNNALVFGSDNNTYINRPASGRLETNASFKIKSVTTAQRPSAATVGTGTMIYDGTLQKLIISNGSVWKDALGNTV